MQSTSGVTPDTPEGIFLVVPWRCKWLWLEKTHGKWQNSANKPFPSKVLHTTVSTVSLRQEGKSWRDIVWLAIWNCGRFALLTASLFEPALSQRQSFHVLKFIWKKLVFLRQFAPHCSFAHAVPHFQVVSATVILNFSQYRVCSNILILHTFNISHP